MKRRVLMFWTCLVLGVLGNTVQAAPQTKESASSGDARLDVEYGFVLERGDKSTDVANLREVVSGDRFHVRVRSRQAGYAYLFVGRDDGSFDLVLPTEGEKRSAKLTRSEWNTLPDSDWLKFNKARGSDRIYLVLASSEVKEIEETFAGGRKSEPVDETWLLDVRNKLEGTGTTTDDVLAQATRVTHRRRGTGSAVVIKEFTIRHK